DDPAADRHRAGTVVAGFGIDQPGVDEGDRLIRLGGGHQLAPSRRAARVASTAMRTATPISTWFWIRLTARSSATSESISTPRFMGPGCMTRTWGAAAASFSRSRP